MQRENRWPEVIVGRFATGTRADLDRYRQGTESQSDVLRRAVTEFLARQQLREKTDEWHDNPHAV
jgi:Arc/MetJ-type ribon-helix-helix transcriptional regulator